MKRFSLVLAFLAWHVYTVHAQCEMTGIEIPAQVCQGSGFRIGNNAVADSFEWDFCPGELVAVPAVKKLVNTGASSVLDLTVAADEGEYVGFAVDASSNSLVRLSFGNSTENIPTRTNLGNIGNLLSFPNAVVLVRESNTWIGLVANGGNDKIILLDFGNSLQNIPVARELHTRASSGFVSISVAEVSPSAFALVIGEYNSSRISVLHYPQGLLMPADGSQSVVIPGSTPIDVQVMRECDSWKVLALSFDNRKLYQLDFGNAFSDTPAISPYDFTFGFEPYRLSLVREGSSFHAFVSSTSGGLSRLDFENTLDNNPGVVALGTFGTLTNSRSLVIGLFQSRWTAFMVNFSDGDLYRLSFTKDCGISPALVTGRDPGVIRYRDGGEKTIAVSAVDAEGGTLIFSETVLITGQPAPEFSVAIVNECVDHDVFFSTTMRAEAVAEVMWGFGDGTTSDLAEPSHVYASAQAYDVSVFVRDHNGCSDIRLVELNIFDAPESRFTLPSATPLCTYQPLVFTNTSDYAAGTSPGWRWFLNGDEISDQRDLTYEMTGNGPHTVALTAGIPGCESRFEQSIGPLAEGVDVDFETTDVCLGTASDFQNTSDGSVNSFLWDFGDGSTSTDQHPVHTYAAYGLYEVKLSTITGNGCNNSESKTAIVRALPDTDFTSAASPGACAGTATLFFDQLSIPDGAEVASRRWDFGDGSETLTQQSDNASHVFTAGGTYTVSLTAETVDGCASTASREVMIFSAPSTAFSHTPACAGAAVSFTGPSGNGVSSWYWEIGNSYYLTGTLTHTFSTPGDYPLYLEVSDEHGCRSSVEKTVRVPRPLAIDFSVSKNCLAHETLFTDITTGEENVSSREWIFQGSGFSAQPIARYTFAETGMKTIRLKVTSASGCQYQKDKQVMILEAPVAGFEASPSSGAAPLEVVFTNTSRHASTYQWDFGDGNVVSGGAEQQHTFASVGEFGVTLTASNAQLCENTFRSTVTTVAARPDVVLEMILVSRNADGSSKIIVTMHNKGNTILRDLPVLIDLSGKLVLAETVDEQVGPGARFNLVLRPAVVSAAEMQYICATAKLAGDIYPEDNKICIQLESSLRVFPVFPNPVSEVLHVEWLSDRGAPVGIHLTDALGRHALSASTASVEGLNARDIQVGNLAAGVYYLIVTQGRERHTERLLILKNP